MEHIGVVIPVYNGSRYLAESVASVRSQVSAAWEAVVVDDGSTDGSGELARRLAADEPRLRVERVARGGVSAARNRGAALLSSKCTRLVFLDADDVWEPNALEVLSAALDAVPDAVAANGVARCTDAAGTLTGEGAIERVQRSRLGITEHGPMPRSAEQPTDFAVLAWYPCILNGTLLYRRAFFERVGGFDPALRWFEDWDLQLRLAPLGAIAFIDRPVLRYRRGHGGNASANPAMYRGLREVRRRALRRLGHDPLRRRQLLLASRYTQARSADADVDAGLDALRNGRVCDAARFLARGGVTTARRLLLDAGLALVGGAEARG